MILNLVTLLLSPWLSAVVCTAVSLQVILWYGITWLNRRVFIPPLQLCEILVSIIFLIDFNA
jgi:hypothetical protein